MVSWSNILVANVRAHSILMFCASSSKLIVSARSGLDATCKLPNFLAAAGNLSRAAAINATGGTSQAVVGSPTFMFTVATTRLAWLARLPLHVASRLQRKQSNWNLQHFQSPDSYIPTKASIVCRHTYGKRGAKSSRAYCNLNHHVQITSFRSF